MLEKSRNAAPLVGELARELAPADQDLLRELVLGVLRWKSALDAEIAGVCRIPMQKLIPGLREIMEVALYQVRHLDRVPQYAAVNAAVDQARAAGGEGAAKLVNGVLRNILLLPLPDHAPPLLPSAREGRGEGVIASVLARHFSHPTFLVERWLARFGAETTRRILAADNAPSRLDLLANPRRTNRDALRAALTTEGIETELSPLAPLALTVLKGNPLRSPLLAAGHFSVQDVGSQPRCRSSCPRVTCSSISPGLPEASPSPPSPTAARAGRPRWTARAGASSESPRPSLVALESRRCARSPLTSARYPWRRAASARVLLDAPCSGTGTLRKNPEIRYRVTVGAIDRLAGAQVGSLSAAARLLAPGGYLLYSTCSLEEEENERVVARVLAGEPDLEPAPIDVARCTRVLRRRRKVPHCSRTSRCDGFTAHLLRRGTA